MTKIITDFWDNFGNTSKKSKSDGKGGVYLNKYFFFNSINGEGVLLKGGQRSTFKMVQFTLNYCRNIIDKANRWMISGRNASNIWDICRRFCFEIIKIIASQEYKCPDQSLFSETNKWVVLISSGWVGNFENVPLSIT